MTNKFITVLGIVLKSITSPLFPSFELMMIKLTDEFTNSQLNVTGPFDFGLNRAKPKVQFTQLSNLNSHRNHSNVKFLFNRK